MEVAAHAAAAVSLALRGPSHTLQTGDDAVAVEVDQGTTGGRRVVSHRAAMSAVLHFLRRAKHTRLRMA